jgi:hypothetical protein
MTLPTHCELSRIGYLRFAYLLFHYNFEPWKKTGSTFLFLIKLVSGYKMCLHLLLLT